MLFCFLSTDLCEAGNFSQKGNQLRLAGESNIIKEGGELLRSQAKPCRYSLTPSLKEGQWNTIFEADGAGMITHIWFTFPGRDKMLGRRNLIRMFWDGEKEPSVVAPLSDFFGLPFGFTGAEYKISSKYIVIAPNNGLNCYFKMPFAKGAKIEIFPEQLQSGGGFYFQADYLKFPEELPAEYKDLRFHSQFRFENPCENYGRNYLFLDATGKGIFLGVTFGIQINYPKLDSWYHGGGDSIFIDGEKNPTVLHGIGAEDFFGHSWGVQEFQSPYIGTPYKELDKDGNRKKYALYRFFVEDPVVFQHSIRAVLGAMANNYSSVAYWYQTKPHKKFFEVPKADLRMPDSQAKYGTYDIEPENAREWKLLAPFLMNKNNPFNKVNLFELKETGKEQHTFVWLYGKPTVPDGNKIEVKWTPQKAYHNFIDFNLIARPATKAIATLSNVVGYALRYEQCEKEKNAVIYAGFDDDIVIRVNDKVVMKSSHPKGFEEEACKVRLKKGKNRILVKLSNHFNTTWKLWAFSFRIEDK
jgi:hypothetical protein